ncbi:Cytochrome P450 2J2 [Holothuria leucospilota]|uniref:Cytochrome P450 2J2 n=1 Tax=Holothuria leucospilota TaxID=206669 RepID=A0A9Q1H5N9_HOLLE|nr:Cytochrome P450 2J2 [Holothuria leucospilota]
MASIELITVIGLILITYICIHIFCRSKKDHDLFKPIPGPFALPIIGNLIDIYRAGYQIEELMVKWAKEYGRVFRIKFGPKNIYVLNDFQLISDAFHHVGIQARPEQKVPMKIFGPGTGIAFANGEVWKEHRRTILNGFRKFGLGQGPLEEKISEEANKLTKAIHRFNGQPMDVSNTFSKASCNIISSLLFDKQLEHDSPILKNDVSHVLNSISSAGPAGLFSTSSLFAYLRPGKIFLEANKNMKKNLDASINQHLQKDNSSYCDLVDVYLERLQETGGPDVPFSKTNLTWFVRDLYIAGTETVSSILRWATLLLMTHPEVQRRCQAELDEVVGRERYPTLADRTNLPYLNATMLEIFRFGDISPLGVNHLATADVDLSGYRIPKGSLVISNTHALMTDPSRWPEPEAFRPERHLDKAGNFVKAKEIIPFGIGRRACVGEKLARTEYFLWLSRLLHQFHFQLPDDGSPVPNIHKGRTGVVRMAPPFRVRFKPRGL